MTQKLQIFQLTELIDLLDNASKEEYKAMGKKISIPIEDFQDYIYYDSESYTRNCIKRTEQYELILLCWEEGQKTPIHCHNEQECWVHVVQGRFYEKRYLEAEDQLELDHQMDLLEEGVSYMNDDMGFHSLENSSNGRSISLHLYMDPIDECQVLDQQTGEFEMKKLEYYSYAGEFQETT